MKEIIIVEDCRADANQANDVFREVGLKNPIRVFATGEEALAYLESAQPPAIILVDIKLPGISGFDVLDYLRIRPAFELTLRVVFSTIEDIQTIKQVYAHGAHSFLSKPANVQEVREFVRSFKHWLGNGLESTKA